jgi:hypothetical protein
LRIGDSDQREYTPVARARSSIDWLAARASGYSVSRPFKLALMQSSMARRAPAIRASAASWSTARDGLTAADARTHSSKLATAARALRRGASIACWRAAASRPRINSSTALTSSSAAPRRWAASWRAASTSSSWPPVIDIALIIKLIPSSAATAAAATPAGAGLVAASASEKEDNDSDQIERGIFSKVVSTRMYQRLNLWRSFFASYYC